MSNEDENDEINPTKLSACTTRVAFWVKQEAECHRSNNLENPVDEIVEGTSADIEQGAIIVVKFSTIPLEKCPNVKKDVLTPGVEPVGYKKYGGEQNNRRAIPQHRPETLDFGFSIWPR